MYRFAEQGTDRSPLGGASTFIPIARTSMFISAFVRFFDRSFQPHLDQVEYGSVDDSASHRLEKFGMRNTIEGNHDTLPIISTFPRESPLSVLAIRSKADHSTFLGRRTAKVDCISF